MKFLTVSEFAKLTKRYPNHIYVLIHKGNKIRKLRAVQINGKWNIPETEVEDFPFTEVDKLKSRLTKQITAMEARIERLERGI